MYSSPLNLSIGASRVDGVGTYGTHSTLMLYESINRPIRNVIETSFPPCAVFAKQPAMHTAEVATVTSGAALKGYRSEQGGTITFFGIPFGEAKR